MKTLSVLLALAGGSLASGFAAVMATKLAGGLRTDTWGLGEAYTFLFGVAGGFAVALVVLLVADLKDARFATLLGSVLVVPCAVVFALFLSVTFLGGTLPRKCYEKKVDTLTENLRRDPRFVDRLVAQARAGTLGKAEKSVLREEVLKVTRVQSNDVPFLVEYFMDDMLFAQSVLNYKKLIGIAEHNSRYAGGITYSDAVVGRARKTLLMKQARRDP